MKANEAPEKIYLIRNFPNSTALNTTNDNHGKFRDEWFMSREKDANVEYTRTDYFIEKATKWLNNNIWAYVEIMHPTVDSYTRINREMLILDFKKVMRR